MRTESDDEWKHSQWCQNWSETLITVDYIVLLMAADYRSRSYMTHCSAVDFLHALINITNSMIPCFIRHNHRSYRRWNNHCRSELQSWHEPWSYVKILRQNHEFYVRTSKSQNVASMLGRTRLIQYLRNQHAELLRSWWCSAPGDSR